MNWVNELQSKARLLHSQIAHVRSLAESSGASDEQLQATVAPYYSMLEDLYQNEYPFAHALDTSDLVVRFQGPAVEADDPEISVVTHAFSEIRTQVQRVARAIFGLAAEDRAMLPAGVDLRLSGLARGSLVVGIRVSEHKDTGMWQTRQLLGDEDPIFQTVRQAVRSLAAVTQFVSRQGVEDGIAEALPDPGIRDAVLVAASRLSPTGKRGIDSVLMYSSSIVGVSRPLTPDVRRAIQKTLSKPVKAVERGAFQGVVREIDLDARRFEIRHVEGIGAIRCVYSGELARASNAWLDRRVNVEGRFDRASNGLPRLLQVESVTVIGVEGPFTQLPLN